LNTILRMRRRKSRQERGGSEKRRGSIVPLSASNKGSRPMSVFDECNDPRSPQGVEDVEDDNDDEL
jgi:hypothetical protein